VVQKNFFFPSNFFIPFLSVEERERERERERRYCIHAITTQDDGGKAGGGKKIEKNVSNFASSKHSISLHFREIKENVINISLCYY